MVCLVDLTVKGVKWGYKQYKLKKAEQEAQQLGNPITMLDPSYEFEAVSPPLPYDTTADGYQPTSRKSGMDMHFANPSGASLSSVSTLETDAQLDRDVEFQRFMKNQREMYVRRQRAKRSSGGESPVTGSEPPPYEVVMAQRSSLDGGRSSTSASVSSSGQTLGINQNDGDVAMSELHADYGHVELDGTASARRRFSTSPVGLSELPTTVARHIAEFAAELSTEPV